MKKTRRAIDSSSALRRHGGKTPQPNEGASGATEGGQHNG